ncbi:MAG: hypothetical protein WD607_07955 [Candidatus Paceibacterota bacterium]
MVFNFFKKADFSPETLNDLWLGLEHVTDSSYKIFLESFGFAENEYGEATRFETHIAVLFYVDYCMASEKISLETRKNFYELAKGKIIEKFSNKLPDTDLADIVDYRYYDEYSQIPVKRGKNWLQSFHSLYEIKLKGTENTDIVEKLPAIKTEEIFEWAPQKASFIRDETANIYKATKLVKELLAGKDLQSILQEIKRADEEIKKELKNKGL